MESKVAATTQRILAGSLAALLALIVAGSASFSTQFAAQANEFEPTSDPAAEEVIPEGDAGNEVLVENGEEGSNDRQLRIAIETSHAFGSEDSGIARSASSMSARASSMRPSRARAMPR